MTKLKMDAPNYAEIARESRVKCLELIYRAQTSHIGSVFSCADIMAVLFEKIDLDKDRFVLSAGWKAAMLYYHLWRKGRITQEELDSYCQKVGETDCEDCVGRGKTFFSVMRVITDENEDIPLPPNWRECESCAGSGKLPVMSKLIGLAEPVCDDIKIAGGSMGLGLPGAVGLALAKKIKGEPGTVYVLMSDGELQCGTTWESALIAAQHKLDNLVVIVDRNELQAMGSTEDVLALEHFPQGELWRKWNSFGWNDLIIDGHKYESIEAALFSPTLSDYRLPGVEVTLAENRPRVIIAHTTKGKGVSFMENNNLYHYKAPNQDEYERAKAELND